MKSDGTRQWYAAIAPCGCHMDGTSRGPCHFCLLGWAIVTGPSLVALVWLKHAMVQGALRRHGTYLDSARSPRICVSSWQDITELIGIVCFT